MSYNTRYKPRRPMNAGLSKRLRAEFAPEVERLSKLLGRDLTHWNRVSSLWPSPKQRTAEARASGDLPNPLAAPNASPNRYVVGPRAGTPLSSGLVLRSAYHGPPSR